MKGFFKEFGTFIKKGNVLDLAVGVVVGTAFSAIVNSLVNDIIMPLVGVIIGKTDFTSLKVVLGSGENAPVLAYGSFIQNVVNFLIIAFSIFCVVKTINKVEAKWKKAEEAKKNEQTALLEEIRDLMKKENKKDNKK